MLTRTRLCILEPLRPLTMALQFDHPRTPLFASKDAVPVQHEDPSRRAQAEDEKPRYYPASTHTLCINFPPASFAAAFFSSAFFVQTFFVQTFFIQTFFIQAFFVQALHHIEANRAEAYPISCSARCLAILRVVVSTPNKAVSVRRLSSHSAYCRPIDSTLLS